MGAAYLVLGGKRDDEVKPHQFLNDACAALVGGDVSASHSVLQRYTHRLHVRSREMKRYADLLYIIY